MHRQIKGTPKTAVVKRTPTGKWFVNITVELREKDLQEKPKAPKGSNEREKKRKIVARTHERIANRRKNFIEQEVCKLVARFGFIAIEALVVRNMVKNPKLAKSIADVLHTTRCQSGRSWTARRESGPGLHESDLLGVRTSSTDAPVGAGLRVSPLWSGHPPRPQWEPQYLSRCPSSYGTTQPRHSRSLRLGAEGSRHFR